MPFGNSTECKCYECDLVFQHRKKLSEHIKSVHKISSYDYYIKHYLNNVTPVCNVEDCSNIPRFVSLGEGFKKYCIEHQHVAESIGGKIGGKLSTSCFKGKTKFTDERLAKLSLQFLGENNHFYGKTHTEEAKQANAEAHRLNYSIVLERICKYTNDSVNVLSNSNDYIDQNSLLKIQCKICNNVREISLFNVKRCWRCINCNPFGSKQQNEIIDFIKTLNVENIQNSTRKIISPYELDVYIPNLNLAIEFHGLVWHSKEGYDKNRHKEKYRLCKEKNIRLIQFFSDEWQYKNDICKSMIRNQCNKNLIKLNARDCIVKDVEQKEAKKFINENHISGYVNCTHKFGLFHNVYGLVGIATTRTPIQKRWGKVIELARMCFKQNMSIRGGASKLLQTIKENAKIENYDGVLSYADLRFGSGKVYEKCGFTFMGETNISYWYTDGQYRYDRFIYRAQPPLTEKEVAQNANVKPIWGCGNAIYVFKF